MKADLFKKTSLYIFPLIVLQILFSSFAIAGKAKSQTPTESSIKRQWQNTKLTEVLKNIQNKTNLFFTYSFDTVDQIRINGRTDNLSVSDLLKIISSETGLSFKVKHDIVYIYGEQNKNGKIKINLPEVRNLTSLQKVVYNTLNCEIPERIIKGIVVDKAGQSLVGATVKIKGTTTGTFTNANGEFSITLSEEPGHILEISYIGYVTKEVAVADMNMYNIVLNESENSMDELTVIGYGTAKKGDLTSSIAVIDNVETLKNRPVTNLQEFLQGSTPGVTVQSESGDPTATPSIIIRGKGSFSNENPLYVVDGMPYYGPAINPNDIESVSILKDASSAAIYGAQAASGVIVITTKKGKSGKPKVDLDLYTGFQNAQNLPTPLNAAEQAQVYNTAADNAGVARQAVHDPAKNLNALITKTNWIDAIFRNAAFYNANVNISGATDRLNYLTSFGYTNREGLLLGTGFERFSARLKTEYNLTKKLGIGENIYLTKSEAVGTNTSSSYSGSIINAIYMPSSAPVYDEKGNFSGTAPESLASIAGGYGDVYNPVALLLRPTKTNPSIYINSNFYAYYDIFDALRFRTSFTYSTEEGHYKEFTPKIPELGRKTLQNNLREEFQNENRWIWDNQLSYIKSFGKNHFDLTAIHSAQNTNYEFLKLVGQGFSSEDRFNQYLANASIQKTPESAAYEDRLTSLIGRAMYNFDHRYFLSASIRRDETSRLAPANQADVFPSFSGAWRVSNEPFFKSNLIDNLKIRASWGQIGNINSVDKYSFNAPLGSATVVLGEDATLTYKGVFADRQSNTNLIWETSESFGVGLDFSLWKKLDVTFDYFNKRTKNMILNGLEDLHQGAKAAKVNGGEVENKGIELSTAYNSKIKEIDLQVGANISTLKNEVLNLDGYNKTGVENISHTEEVRSSLYPYRSVIGRSLYSTYLIPYKGIFNSQAEIDSYVKEGKRIQPNAQPGDFKFEDVNNDGKISELDRVFNKSYFPKFTYGFNVNAFFKGFDLGMIWQGVNGISAFNGSKYTTFNAAQSGYNLDNRVLNTWTETNTSTNIPRLSVKDNNQNFGTISDWYLEDASYLRLKNLTVGYRLPELGHTSIRVYGSAENLLTFTKYTGLDPEVGGIGLDLSRYPVSRRFTIGASLSF